MTTTERDLIKEAEVLREMIKAQEKELISQRHEINAMSKRLTRAENTLDRYRANMQGDLR